MNNGITGSKKHKRWIKFALKQAKKSKQKYKMSAVLIKSNRVISIGINSDKCGRLIHECYGEKKWHCESACLYKLDKETIENGILYVAGFNSSGEILLSKPCINCQEYLKQFKLKKIIYLTLEGMYDMM